MEFNFDNLPSSDSAVIEQHSRSFSLAARLLQKETRSDVVKLYAWCRWCDDAVDEAASRGEAIERVNLLTADVERIYAGQQPKHVSSKWLADIAIKYNIPIELPIDLLSGMKADVSNPVFETEAELLHYCYQAAGTVGLMMCRIMGVSSISALRNAEALGIAMQLTNIARDISEDWRTGRRYVPKKWLPLIPKKDMTPSNKEVRRAVQELLSLAEIYYVQGYEGFEHLPDGSRIAIRVAGNVYQEIGNEISRQEFAVMSGRIFVPRKTKIQIVAKCLVDEAGFRFNRFLNKSASRVNKLFYTDYTSTGELPMNNDTRYLAWLGLSLTFVMATTLFFLMGMNPKKPSYDMLPWIYTGGCALVAAATGLLAKSCNRQLELPASQENSAAQR
ncbi:MAG: phytoene/squalene synthase family protein [Mariniblastus sp.]